MASEKPMAAVSSARSRVIAWAAVGLAVLAGGVAFQVRLSSPPPTIVASNSVVDAIRAGRSAFELFSVRDPFDPRLGGGDRAREQTVFYDVGNHTWTDGEVSCHVDPIDPRNRSTWRFCCPVNPKDVATLEICRQNGSLRFNEEGWLVTDSGRVVGQLIPQ
jgi:hypothetical protein